MTDAAGLAWIANLGCIDLNTWPTRLGHLEKPDYLLIDLDPGPVHPWAHVREIALAVGEVMSDLGMRGYPKTSGSTGLHVLAPIRPELEFPEVRRFAKALAEQVEKRVPEIATTTWRVADRDGVFVDYGQNARDHSIATAYSIRPTPDARASTPLHWDEVAEVEPARFTLATMRERVAETGDPSAGMWRRKVSLLPRFEKLELDAPRSRQPTEAAQAHARFFLGRGVRRVASDAPVAMTHGLFCQHATAPASPGILASGDWSVGHFVARAPKLGSDLDVSAATVVAHADRVFTDGQWLFAHDGSLGAYEQLEPTLWAETEPQLRPHRSGESESELVFLWLLSRLTAFGLGEATHGATRAAGRGCARGGSHPRRLGEGGRGHRTGRPDPRSDGRCQRDRRAPAQPVVLAGAGDARARAAPRQRTARR